MFITFIQNYLVSSKWILGDERVNAITNKLFTCRCMLICHSRDFVFSHFCYIASFKYFNDCFIDRSGAINYFSTMLVIFFRTKEFSHSCYLHHQIQSTLLLDRFFFIAHKTLLIHRRYKMKCSTDNILLRFFLTSSVYLHISIGRKILKVKIK